MNPQDLQAELARFTGTETYHRHSLNRHLLWTDGVEFFARQCKTFWFIDGIAVGWNGRRGPVPSVVPGKDRMGIVLLKVADGKANLEIRSDYNEQDDTCGSVLYREKIGHTDCPEGVWKFYLVADDRHVTMMLPGEY